MRVPHGQSSFEGRPSRPRPRLMSGNHLKNTADRLEAIRKIVTNGVWLMLVVLILAGLGHFLLSLDATLGDRDRERATTPPAPQIRKVEEVLGVKIFERSRKEILLTP